MNHNQNEGQIARSSSDTAGTDRSKVSVIEKSVTHLLVATKTLLETLTKWSRHGATETEVSDVYVRLGYEFNIACRAFKSVGVETSDLGPVPDLLRGILEETLSGEPSQVHLDKYLPQIRDIIVNLLQGLKKKQQKLRQRNAKDRDVNGQSQGPSSSDARQSSGASIASNDEGISRQSGRYSDARRHGGESSDSSRSIARSSSAVAPSTTRSSSSDKGSQLDQSRRAGTVMLDDGMPLPAYGVQAAATAMPSFPQQETIPAPSMQSLAPPVAEYGSPRPQPQADALARLQRGGELERRASRRFSAYQIQKHLGTTSSGIPMMPPTQHSPVPNRGRDLHESMNAVRSRGGTTKNKYSFDTSPSRPAEKQDRISEEPMTPNFTAPTVELPSERSPERYLVAKPQGEEASTRLETAQPPSADEQGRPQWSTETLSRVDSPMKEPEKISERSRSAQESSAQTVRRYPRLNSESAPDLSAESPQSTKELVLFLQYKTQIKKFVLADGYEELSIPRLQLAFIEKFAWNTHSNGVDLPEIYVQDPISGVRHELEDLNDVKNRSVLVLNVDAVDEVKKHMDDGLGGLRSLLQDVRMAITDQSTAIQRVAEKQQESAKDLIRLSKAPPVSIGPARVASQPLPNGNPSRRASTAHISEIQTLRRDLAIMRQSHTSWVTEMESVIANVRSKAQEVKSIAAQPSFASSGESTSGRSYVNAGRKTLSSTSEAIMNRVEELQDTVEDLRKDVVTRGVRPLPRQLETISRELSSATSELKKMQDYIKQEKPTWTKIWKNELQVVCEDQNLLTYQEELVVDLEDDLKSAANTFDLIEEATKQQNLSSQTLNGGPGDGNATPGGGSLRNTSRTILRDTSADPMKAKDGVLGEVKALQPNHETRLEAIARAERLRQRELEERREGEFKKELSGFVDEGRLKKSGGVEEAERVRKVKDERMRQLVWETKNGIRDTASTLDSQTVPPVLENLDTNAQAPNPDNVADVERSFSSPETATADLSALIGPAEAFSDDLSIPEKVDAAIAESATVPQPLDVPDVNGHGRADGDPTTPDAEFVDARS